MTDDRGDGVRWVDPSRYDQFLMRCAAINCGVGVAIGLMGGVEDGITVVLLSAAGLVSANMILRVVGVCFQGEAAASRNGGRDRD